MKRNFILGFLMVSLSGCATTLHETNEPKKFIPLTQTSSIHLVSSWPTSHEIYLQKVKAIVNRKPFIFSVHLTLDKDKFEARAFNDICGSLYHLTWTPGKTTWKASEYIPDILKPEYIIADVLLTYMSKSQLEMALKGVQVRQTGTLRTIISNGKEIRRIHSTTRLGDLWKKVTLQNLEVGYELEIETVPL